ncbi:DUF1127 domain-containing protein [Nisaea sediminum]|uniref:DUF1127 domain-containing protein n=1 Tax=Nisaea sediminum TaxID=2775867 RepID=UPI001867A48B|nr:DUF1127 domain-containing protein [Nisaea sediminum]
MTRHQFAAAGGLGARLLRAAGIQGWWLPLHLLRCLSRRIRHRKEYEHLQDLPDYLLRDIGISRTEIEERIQRPFL